MLQNLTNKLLLIGIKASQIYIKSSSYTPNVSSTHSPPRPSPLAPPPTSPTPPPHTHTHTTTTTQIISFSNKSILVCIINEHLEQKKASIDKQVIVGLYRNLSAI